MMNIKTWNDLYAITDEAIANATDKELKELSARLSKGMDMYFGVGSCFTERQYETLDRLYWAVGAERDARYAREQGPLVQEYFAKHFAGKSATEISNSKELIERWDFYSDWYKDCYGHRPHIG